MKSLPLKTQFPWLIALGSIVGAIVLAWLVDTFGTLGAILGIGGAAAIWLGTAILANPKLGLWFILFFLPFERIPAIDIGGITLRLNFFFGAVTIVAALGAWAFGRLRGRPNPLVWPLLVYFFAAVLGLGIAVETDRTLTVLIFTFFTAGFAFLVINLLRTKQDLAKALGIIFASTVIVGVFGIYQFLGDAAGLPLELTGLDQGYSLTVLGFPRVQAFSIEPLYLGNYLLLPLALLYSVLMLRVKHWPRGILWLLFALLSVILVLTVSRGAYLGAAATLAMLIVTLPRETLRPKHILTGLVLFAVVIAGSVYFIAKGEDDAIAEFQEHVTLGDFAIGESTQGRLRAFGVAWEAWEDNPWFGIGLGNFGAYVKGYPDPRELTGYDIVNNEYLEVLAETGLVGFLSLAVMVALVLSRSVVAFKVAKDPLVRASLAGSTAALVGLLTQYNFFSTLFIIHVWVFIGFAVAAQNIALVPQERVKARN